MNGDGLTELCVEIAREQARAVGAPPADSAQSEDEAARLEERLNAYGEALSELGRGLAAPRAMHEFDEAAFDRAEAAWHERYRRTFSAAARHGDREQAHDEAVGEALEEFLGVYERDRAR